MVCIPDWQHATWAFYRYVPSVSAAVVFCLLFFVSTALHLWQMCTTKAWFLTALVVGCLFFLVEFIGFAARTASARQVPGCWTLMPYIIQSMFILLAPALISASVYMILGRIILLTDGEDRSVIKQRWVTKMFVCGDIICFTLQSGGGGLVAGGRDNQTLAGMGNRVIIAGLILQLLWFIFFIISASIFHRRMLLAPTATSQHPANRWQSYLRTLYLVSGLIVVRSAFRVVEYIQGNAGYLLTNEAFLYVFDAVPMFVVVSWLHWEHPSEISIRLRGGQAHKNGFSLITLDFASFRSRKHLSH